MQVMNSAPSGYGESNSGGNARIFTAQLPMIVDNYIQKLDKPATNETERRISKETIDVHHSIVNYQ